MKHLTKKQYEAFATFRELNSQVTALQKEARAAKDEVLKAMGRAMKVETPEGTVLQRVLVEVTPTEVPAPYSYFKLKEG